MNFTFFIVNYFCSFILNLIDLRLGVGRDAIFVPQDVSYYSHIAAPVWTRDVLISLSV